MGGAAEWPSSGRQAGAIRRFNDVQIRKKGQPVVTDQAGPALRTGSSEAPASARRGVIRRRLRWVLRVVAVLVLALLLAVGATVRDNQRAEALVPMLAPVAPVLVASGPPGWAALAGAGVLLGGVYLAEQMREDGEDGHLEWWDELTTPDPIAGGLLDWFSNEDKDAEPSRERQPDPGMVIVQPDDGYHLTNWRETESSGGNRQLTVDVDYDKVFSGFGKTYEVWASVHKTCRGTDGTMHPEIKVDRLANASSWAKPDVWPDRMFSAACSKGTLTGVVFNPMTQADWKQYSPDGAYPQAHTASIAAPQFYYFKDHWSGTTGDKITLVCERPDGSKVTSTVSAKDGEDMPVPGCEAGAEPESLTAERTNPDGTVHPSPIAEAEFTGERPLDVVVDGQPCVQGREGCANWTEVNQVSPERVQCVSAGAVIPTEHCNPVERFYENGGTVVHPLNQDGDPSTFYDPWSDPSFKPVVQQPDGTYAPAPYRPTEQPPVIAPEPWEPDPNWEVPDTIPDEWTEPSADPAEPEPEPTGTDPYKDPSSPLYDPYQDPNNPKYDPYADPDSPLFDPDYDPAKHDPESPDYEPEPQPTTPAEPEPTTPVEPEPEPTSPVEPEPTSPEQPEPSAEPTGDTDEDEDAEPEPTDEPTEVVDPDLEPELQPGESQPPIPPLPTAVDTDEFGHLLPVHAMASTATTVDPTTGGIVYTKPDVGLQTVRAPDGTTVTTHTPTNTVTTTAPEGTKTTTRPDTPTITTGPTMGTVPGTGTHPVEPKVDTPNATCEGPFCVDIDVPETDPQTRTNCMAGGWSWNPIDWVKTPVVCALREAFEPDPRIVSEVIGNLRTALGARGIKPLIDEFESSVIDINGGGSGCMGPPVNLSIASVDKTFYFFEACEHPKSDIAFYTKTFLGFLIVINGFAAIIRNVAQGFGHTVKIGTETGGASE